MRSLFIPGQGERGEAAMAAAVEKFAGSLRAFLSDPQRTAVLFLVGGNSVVKFYVRLAVALRQFPPEVLARIHFALADERVLENSPEDLNMRVVEEHLLRQLRCSGVVLDGAQVHPFVPDFTADDFGATRYFQSLPSVNVGRFVILGSGEDGHAASLFPPGDARKCGSGTMMFGVDNAPKAPPRRVTISPGLICTAKCAVSLFIGQDKKGDAFRRAVLERENPETCPIGWALLADESIVVADFDWTN